MNHCVKCGANLEEQDKFCPNCGTPVQRGNNNEGGMQTNTYHYERPTNQPKTNYGSQNHGQSYQNTNQSGGIGKVVVIILLIMAVIASIGFVIYAITSTSGKNNDSNMKEKSNNSSISSSNSNNNGSSTSSTNSGNMTPVTNQQTSSYKVNYGGFKLYIPDDLIYEMDYTNKAINIGDASSTWVSQLAIQQVPFKNFKQNKSQIKAVLDELLNNEAKVSSATIETIEGVEFIIAEVNAGGMNVCIGLAELNSMYSACMVIMNEENDFNREYFKRYATIIRTAEYTGDSSYMNTNSKIKIEDIKNALQRVTQAQ